MNEYLMLFRGGEAIAQGHSPQDWQQHMHRWTQWLGDLQERGLLLGAQPLSPTGKQIIGKQKAVINGPFAGGDDKVAGYLMCRAGSYHEALDIATGCPILEFENGNVEVREIQELKM